MEEWQWDCPDEKSLAVTSLSPTKPFDAIVRTSMQCAHKWSNEVRLFTCRDSYRVKGSYGLSRLYEQKEYWTDKRPSKTGKGHHRVIPLAQKQCIIVLCFYAVGSWIRDCQLLCSHCPIVIIIWFWHFFRLRSRCLRVSQPDSETKLESRETERSSLYR